MSSKDAGKKLRAFRERSGMSQADLASKVGLSQAYISQLETGERPISLTVSADIERLTNSEIRMQDWVDALDIDGTFLGSVNSVSDTQPSSPAA